MKRLVLAVGIFLFLCVAANAQKPIPGVTGMGFKLGFGIADINTDDDTLDEFLDSHVGFSGGAYLTYNLNRQFAIQPELLLVVKGTEKDLFLAWAKWVSTYLEVPVLLKFDAMPDGPVHPNLFAGPALGVLLSSSFEAKESIFDNSIDVDVTDGMKTADFSLVFGAGLDYKHITIDARYTLGLTNTIDAKKVNQLTGAGEDDWYYLEGDPSVKNTNISFMIGVRF